MKRHIKLIILILCISLMMPSYQPSNKPVVAASNNSADILFELGLLSNIKSSEMYIDLNRLVGLTMILKAMGYTDLDARKVSNNSVFVDLNGSYSWGVGWVNIGVEKSITTGTSYNTFSPGYTLTKKEFVIYLLRLLGYGVEESYNECVELAIEAGLINTKSDLSDSYFTKQDATDVLYTALSATLKGKGNKTLIEEMIEAGIVNREVAIKHKIAGSNELLVSTVTPLSNTYLQIDLAKSTEFVSVDDFKLIDYYDDEIDIEDAKLYNHGRTIIIETDEQEEDILHTLTVNHTEYTYEALPDEDYKPRLIDVEVINNTSIRLIFNEAMSKKALDKDNYSINNLTVKSAEYELIEIEEDEDEDSLNDEWEDEVESDEEEKEYELILSNIILTTSKQTRNKSYRVDVEGVTDLSYNKIHSSYDYEHFSGDGASDLELKRADAINSTRIRLTFSEDLDKKTAEDEDNYTIKGLTIKKAVLDSNYPYRVYLTTSEQKEDYKYKVEVSNVKSIHGDRIDSSHDSDTFYGAEKDDKGPRLIDVRSLSNTKVEVVFNEPIEKTTALMEYAYYFGEELGYALEVEIDEDEDDGTVWIVTTMSQLDQEYTLTVRGLKDLEGNLIDEDYTQEVFNGTPDD